MAFAPPFLLKWKKENKIEFEKEQKISSDPARPSVLYVMTSQDYSCLLSHLKNHKMFAVVGLSRWDVNVPLSD